MVLKYNSNVAILTPKIRNSFKENGQHLLVIAKWQKFVHKKNIGLYLGPD